MGRHSACKYRSRKQRKKHFQEKAIKYFGGWYERNGRRNPYIVMKEIYDNIHIDIRRCPLKHRKLAAKKLFEKYCVKASRHDVAEVISRRLNIDSRYLQKEYTIVKP